MVWGLFVHKISKLTGMILLVDSFITMVISFDVVTMTHGPKVMYNVDPKRALPLRDIISHRVSLVAPVLLQSLNF